MAKCKITVQNSKGHTLIVQPSQIPAGYKYVGDYKSPKKAATKSKKNEK